MSRGDIITDAVEIAMSIVPSITEEQGQMIERVLRQRWGGQRIDYVAKTSQADKRARAVMQGRHPPEAEAAAVRDYLDNKPIAEITRQHGVSRAALYRALKR